MPVTRITVPVGATYDIGTVPKDGLKIDTVEGTLNIGRVTKASKSGDASKVEDNNTPDASSGEKAAPDPCSKLEKIADKLRDASDKLREKGDTSGMKEMSRRYGVADRNHIACLTNETDKALNEASSLMNQAAK